MQEACIKTVHFSPHYLRTLQKLPRPIQELTDKKDQWFRMNPFDPRLHVHPLKGHLAGAWSYSVNYEYRVLFRFLNKDEVIYYDIGTHDIYK
jgi:mRNA-degrading endonuclease RelE of RelBE toxin-antitoxin system